MKVKRTKRQLVFKPLSVLDELKFRYAGHVEHYGIIPTKIFLPAKMFDEYKALVPKVDLFLSSIYWNDRIFFRGAEVINGDLTHWVKKGDTNGSS